MAEGFVPCFWCGSTGACEHLAEVLVIAGNPPIPVRARGGREQAVQAASRAVAEMVRQRWEAGAAIAAGRANDERGEMGSAVAVLTGLLAALLALVAILLAIGLRPDFGWVLEILR